MKPKRANPSWYMDKNTSCNHSQYREAIQLCQDQEAIQAFKQATRMGADDASAYFGLGMAFYNLGQYANAIAALLQAIRIKPDYTSARFSLGLIYLSLNDSFSVLEQYTILKNSDIEKASTLYNLMSYLTLDISAEGHQ